MTTPTARQLARLAVLAHRKRHSGIRTDAAGSPSESLNRPLLNQIIQARSLLANFGSPPPYEIPAMEKWNMRGIEKRVREELYGSR